MPKDSCCVKMRHKAVFLVSTVTAICPLKKFKCADLSFFDTFTRIHFGSQNPARDFHPMNSKISKSKILLSEFMNKKNPKMLLC